ncbi:hypothetical protein EYF80_003995 [Liparis tanakae]|uniref:Uncharacterized protein n=1 Tax=Liparis tanakae TaxID=230148 RepID=A0A4Z2J7S7_9TELE|nr:hypothetical protein EYF80_003995 [Liparis tanakae]
MFMALWQQSIKVAQLVPHYAWVTEATQKTQLVLHHVLSTNQLGAFNNLHSEGLFVVATATLSHYRKVAISNHPSYFIEMLDICQGDTTAI